MDFCSKVVVSIYKWLRDALHKVLSTHFSQIADGQRELIRSHSVKKRHFIGNTSMDAGLSFIMANHGKVKAHDLVYDPFVGTGEIKHIHMSGFYAVMCRPSLFSYCVYKCVCNM